VIVCIHTFLPLFFMEQPSSSQDIRDILEVVHFIRDNAATKQDIAELKNEIARLDTKIDTVHDQLDAKIDTVHDRLDAKIDTVHDRLDAKIDTVRNDMITHVDGFVGLYRTHEAELAAVMARVNRCETKLDKVIAHPNLQTT
jgi:predicted  nucleic acid-binding Zn-ribbon protein